MNTDKTVRQCGFQIAEFPVKRQGIGLGNHIDGVLFTEKIPDAPEGQADIAGSLFYEKPCVGSCI